MWQLVERLYSFVNVKVVRLIRFPLQAGKQLELSSVCLAVMQCVLVLSFNLAGIVSPGAPPHADPLMILSCNETFFICQLFHCLPVNIR